MRRFSIGLFVVAITLLANQHLYPRATVPFSDISPLPLGSDFYSPWYGSRAAFSGQDPYDQTVAQAGQRHRYGRVLSEPEVRRGLDQERFAYPLPVSFLLAPLVGLDFESARHIAWLAFVLATLLSVFLWSGAMRWSPPLPVLSALALLLLFSPISARALNLTQVALLVAALLAAAFWATVKGHLFTAGVLLALALVKPQMACLSVAWLLPWSISCWPERKRLLMGFSAMLLLLAGCSLALLPSWPLEFFAGLVAYRDYTGAPSAFGAILGKHAGPFVAWPLLGILAIAAWRFRKARAGSMPFSIATAATLAATVWAVPAMWDSYNQLLMLPAFCLLGRYFQAKKVQEPPPPLSEGVLITIEKAWSAEPKALVARKVNEYVPAKVGVPEIIPPAEPKPLSASPVGSDPETSE